MVRSFKTLGYFTKAVLKCKNQQILMQISQICQLLLCVLVCLLEVNISMIMLYMYTKKEWLKHGKLLKLLFTSWSCNWCQQILIFFVLLWKFFFCFFVSKMCFYALFWNLENLENGNFYQEINVKNLENLENGQLRPKKNLENGTFQPGKTWKMTPESLWPPCNQIGQFPPHNVGGLNRLLVTSANMIKC